VLVAPGGYKGTLRASEVAAALARGLEAGGRRADPCPLADGGEGTLETLMLALGGETAAAEVSDPLGRPVRAGFGLVEGGATAIVETVQAIGPGLVAPRDPDAEAASSRGAGELILAAVETGAREIVVALGGSAASDGGAGALEAIERGGGLRGAGLVALCDARTPLGGLAGGLRAAHGAALAPGAAFVLDAIGYDERMRAAHAVIVGEGRLDRRTLGGKAAGEAAVRARQAGVPCFAVCGRRALDDFDARILDLQAVLEAGDPPALERAGRALAEMV